MAAAAQQAAASAQLSTLLRDPFLSPFLSEGFSAEAYIAR
jgi:hypothetical protein